MSDDKAGRSTKRPSKTVDGVKYGKAPPETPDGIARKLGSRIHRTKQDKPDELDGDGQDDHRD